MRFLLPSLLALLSVPATAADPIDTRNHRSVALPFLRLPFRTSALAPGAREWSAGITSANEFRIVGTVVEDSETQRLNLRLRQGEKWGEWSVDLPILSRGSGFQDPIIDGWHKLVLGWSDPVRDATKFGRSQVSNAGRYSFGSATGIGDITVGAAKSFGRLSTQAALKLPTGDRGELLGSGSPDLGVAIGYASGKGKWHGHAMAGLVLQGRASRLGQAAKLAHQLGLALIYQPNSRDEWILQWQSEEAPIRTGQSRLDLPHRMVTVGYRRRVADRQWLELAFSEDEDLPNRRAPLIASAGPDLTLIVRWVWRM